MTAISWFLEFTAGTIGMVLRYMEWGVNVSDLNAFLCLAVIDIGLNFIVIPSSYILSNGVVKGLIIAEGWCEALKPSQNSGKVQPAHNEDVPPSKAANPIPRPIPTISGNIDQLVSRNGLHNLGRELNNLPLAADRQLFQGIETIGISHERDQLTQSGHDGSDNDIELVVMSNSQEGASAREERDHRRPKMSKTAWN